MKKVSPMTICVYLMLLHATKTLVEAVLIGTKILFYLTLVPFLLIFYLQSLPFFPFISLSYCHLIIKSKFVIDRHPILLFEYLIKFSHEFTPRSLLHQDFIPFATNSLPSSSIPLLIGASRFSNFFKGVK